MQMKAKYRVKENRPLADFLPTLTIAAKNLATEMTNYNVTEKDMYGEKNITAEHVDNNLSVRNMLNKRGIKPENLKPAEDLKKLERRVKSESKKIADSDNYLKTKQIRLKYLLRYRHLKDKVLYSSLRLRIATSNLKIR